MVVYYVMRDENIYYNGRKLNSITKSFNNIKQARAYAYSIVMKSKGKTGYVVENGRKRSIELDIIWIHKGSIRSSPYGCVSYGTIYGTSNKVPHGVMYDRYDSSPYGGEDDVSYLINSKGEIIDTFGM